MKSVVDELNAIQERCGYLPGEELVTLSQRTNIPLYRLHGVASFYPHFHLQPPPPTDVQLCGDICCRLRGGEQIESAVRARYEGDAGVRVSTVSCLGQCERSPALTVNDTLLLPADDLDLLDAIERLRRQRNSRTERGVGSAQSGPKFGFDPYSGASDYAALRQAQGEGAAERVLEALRSAGLRGMGGAGFPAGAKWEIVRKAVGAPKYVVCNADESEPGTFKDRVLMERAPHLLVEGMLIAAEVVGAAEVTIFLRHEYHEAGQRLAAELERCRALGLIGDGGVEVRVFTSPGGYICGEETALLEALEGKRAEPRNKPPFPGTNGLWGKPTLINNVETLAYVPAILLRGADWFRSHGRNDGVGPKLLALSGDVERPGVYEVALGISAGELFAEHGGGMLAGRALKAFMPGGASSGFLPASMADTPLDFAPLAKVGSMLGSGAVIAVGEGRCMLDLALNVVRFFRNESCGKCVPCRTGSEHLVRILEGFRRGIGGDAEVALIEELAEAMQQTSICGLGQVAAAPITSALKHFPDEILAHIRERRCPAGVCPTGGGGTNGVGTADARR